MPRGGYRPGSGGKFKWKHGKTKVVRLPEALVEQVMELAIALDRGLSLATVTSSSMLESEIDGVTLSKIIDLSGVSIRSLDGEPVVYIVDLLNLGYQIEPEALAKSASLKKRKESYSRVQEVKREIQVEIDEIDKLEGLRS